MRHSKRLIVAFALLAVLSACGRSKPVAPEDRLLRIHDTLYHGTIETGPMGDSDAVGGKILSTVNADQIPREHGQSNFGEVGAPYTENFGLGFIQVLVDEQWYVFHPEE